MSVRKYILQDYRLDTFLVWLICINFQPLKTITSTNKFFFYHLSKQLAKLLSPLNLSEYAVKNKKEFIEQFKNISSPENSKLVSFDVSLLFMNLPLDYTIDMILRRIYRDKEINTGISKELQSCYS